MFGGKWIERIDNFGAWILLFLVLLFVVTGFGMTKHIMDPVLAKYIHAQLLPVPLLILLLIHVLQSIYKQMKKWNIFKSERALNVYVYLLAFIITGLLLWLYFW